jgi:uncharacterized ion transporter superfamily protein YfcC
LVLFGLAFLIMIVSVIPWSDLGITRIATRFWWFPELTALFLFFAIVIGIVGRMNEQELVNGFIDGARDLLGVALVVGLARGVSVVMNNGLIIDTVSRPHSRWSRVVWRWAASPLDIWWKFAMPLLLMLAGVIIVVLSAGVLIRT